MSQHDQNIANSDGATVRADINNAFGALFSMNSGASAPTTTVPYMFWADTTSSTLKRRNAANSAWIVIRTLDESFVLSRGSNTILGVSDVGKYILASGTYSQTFTAVATLADGWYIDYKNDGTGLITLDPNSSETIDELTTLVLYPGQSCRIYCNGSKLKTAMLNAVGKQTVFMPAGALKPRTGATQAGCTALATTNGASNQPDIEYLSFLNGVDQYARFCVNFSNAWDARTVTAKFHFRRASGTSAANVVLGIRGLAVGNAESPVAAFGTGVTVTQTCNTTTANLTISSETGAVTLAGTPAKGDMCWFEVYRQGSSGSDTLGAALQLVGITLYYNTDAPTDA